MSVIERLLRRDDGALLDLGGLVIEPMQRRDLRRGVMAIEAVRPWNRRDTDAVPPATLTLDIAVTT